MMLTREVLVIVPVSDDALNRMGRVDRCLHVVDARAGLTSTPRDVAAVDGTALPRPACRINQFTPGARPAAGPRRDHPRRLSVSAGSPGPGAAPALVPSTSRPGRHLLRGDLWGKRCHRHHLARLWNTAPWPSMCWPASSTSPGGSTMHLAIGSDRFDHPPTVPCRCRVKRCASWAPVASARRWGACAPMPACG